MKNQGTSPLNGMYLIDKIVLRYERIQFNNETDLMQTLNLSLDNIWNEFVWFNGNGDSSIVR